MGRYISFLLSHLDKDLPAASTFPVSSVSPPPASGPGGMRSPSFPAARPRPGFGLSRVCDFVHAVPDENGGGGEGMEVQEPGYRGEQGRCKESVWIYAEIIIWYNAS